MHACFCVCSCFSPSDYTTVLACVSADGRLHIFDLAVSKLAPVLSVAVTDETLADAADANKVSSSSTSKTTTATAANDSGDGGSSKSKPSGIAAFRAAALAAKATAAFSSAGAGAGAAGSNATATTSAAATAKSKAPSRPVAAHCVAWNGQDGSLLAVGDSRGVVSVWQVSPRLATLQVTDKAVLDKLSIAATASDEAD